MSNSAKTVVITESTYYAAGPAGGGNKTIYLVRVDEMTLDASMPGLTDLRAVSEWERDHTQIIHREQHDSAKSARKSARQLAAQYGCTVSDRIPSFVSRG